MTLSNNNNNNNKSSSQFGSYYEPGIDVTASLWQIIQHSTIQHQLDSSHIMYSNSNNNNNNNNNSSNNHQYYQKRTKEIGCYEFALRMLKWRSSILLVLPETIVRFFEVYVPIPPLSDFSFRKDVDMFDKSITNLYELRCPKRWCKYMLTDGVIRYGCIQKHPNSSLMTSSFSVLPGWLVDAINIFKRKKKQINSLNLEKNNDLGLGLVWCTDVRGVSNYMGSVCSLINLHHLFQRFEYIHQDNFTVVLAHMTVLSTAPLNSITRRGLHYPMTAISSRTFEDIRRSLLKLTTRYGRGKNKKKEREKKGSRQ